MIGRDMSIPVHINGRDLAGASICMVGERPNVQSLEVINAFRKLVADIYGKPVPMRFAGPTARLCGEGRVIVLRLYSGAPPNRALSDDLNWMNQTYQFGLPKDRFYAASSPAMAQTFFGHRGQGTHIMVQQTAFPGSDRIDDTFFRSILIEELFQSYTFGMDILQFDRAGPFFSKLQEVPLNLHRLPWGSRAFKRALLSSNPPGLCEFDIMMMHAVARSPADQTTMPVFIDFIDHNFEKLVKMTRATINDETFAAIIDPTCTPVAD
ncbi:hypothetical protein [Roseovarius aestuariivivens]|uniref:hypothetical protein n=1 Tax=Roseovarius aestuariivivens TaxID=1888910 RepID=UPI001FD95A98|nr:hypothetical protein [Roseovarius aestuariivivens]